MLSENKKFRDETEFWISMVFDHACLDIYELTLQIKFALASWTRGVSSSPLWTHLACILNALRVTQGLLHILSGHLNTVTVAYGVSWIDSSNTRPLLMGLGV